MKMLALTALEPAHRAFALGGQATAALGPCRRHLTAAIRDAEKRSVIERARWESAPDRRRILLEPIDTPFERTRDALWYTVEGLSASTVAGRLDLPLVVDFRHFETVLEHRVDAGSVRIRLASPPAPTAVHQWGGDRVTLVPATDTSFPSAVFSADGVRLNMTLLHGDGQRPDRILAEGAGLDALYDADRVPLEWKPQPWHAGLTTLREGERRMSLGERARPDAPVEVEGSPTAETLLGDNGVRFRWRGVGKGDQGRRGVWVHLLPVDKDDEANDDAEDDPRAAFFGEGVTEVRIHQARGPGSSLRVIDGRRDGFELCLSDAPPPNAILELPNSLDTLRRQREAVYTLSQSPRPHHRPLLRLVEHPEKCQWPAVVPESVDDWHLLTNEALDGTSQQRAFVQRALGTPDFAFLEGPPGSGKTHAICELVLQAVARDLTIVLCSSTHAAVDNVLERLVGVFPQVRAVRIGKVDRVDERVQSCQLDAQVDALCEAWAASGRAVGDARQAATAFVVGAANLVAGTTTGIQQHPMIRSGTGQAHFDLLIIDESSKATFQEFLVPALCARRWIIVGDARQLPPFTNIRDVEASLESLADSDRESLTPAHQRALLVLRKLVHAPRGVRVWVREDDATLDALQRELDARRRLEPDGPRVVRLVSGRATTPNALGLAQLETADGLLRLQAADWVLASPGVAEKAEPWLPPELEPTTEPADAMPLLTRRQSAFYTGAGRHMEPARADMMRLRTGLRETTWAKEVAWRLARMHQFDRSRSNRSREHYRDEIRRLAPKAEPVAGWFFPALDGLLDVGMRSVIESLQYGRNREETRRSALSDGLPTSAWQARSVLLRYQHRMDPGISDLPRELFYSEGGEASQALLDANTLTRREPFWFDGFPKARVWKHVPGQKQRGENPDEVQAIRVLLERFARQCPGPRPDGRPWEIACLSPYNGQVTGLRRMLRQLTGRTRGEARFAWSHAEIFCSTVDRFQGREADVVFLSLRNTDPRRPGHIDSPNRLNVAMTRARRLLVIVGHQDAYRRCDVDELRAFAERTPRI